MSGFSGQMFFESFLLQTYNLIYTSWPIIVYATFDEEFEKGTLLENPFLYVDGIQGILYNQSVFWQWIRSAVVESFLLVLISFYGLNYYPTTLGSTQGQLPDMWLIGTVVYFSCVFIVNNKLLLDANSLSFIPIVIYLMSTGMVIIAFLIVNEIPGDSLHKNFLEFWDNAGIVFTLILFAFFIWPLGTFYHFWFESERYDRVREEIKEANRKRELINAEHPQGDQQIREEDGLRGSGIDSAVDLEAFGDEERERLMRQEQQRQAAQNAFVDFKQISYGADHTGFAFAGEEGHVPQITENLKKNGLDQDV